MFDNSLFCLESTRKDVRQNLLEKRNQLEKDLLAEKENKENQPAGLTENKSVRKPHGTGVKIVITEPEPESPQKEESVVRSKESTDVLPKTAGNEKEKMTDGKNNKSENEKKNLREIIVGRGFGKRKAIKDVTIKNRHQVV